MSYPDGNINMPMMYMPTTLFTAGLTLYAYNSYADTLAQTTSADIGQCMYRSQYATLMTKRTVEQYTTSETTPAQ